MKIKMGKVWEKSASQVKQREGNEKGGNLRFGTFLQLLEEESSNQVYIKVTEANKL